MINELTFPHALRTLRHGRKTDLSKGVVNNIDATMMILAANGGSLRVGEIRALLRGWRPLEAYGSHELWFKYMFNSYYGHVVTEDRDVEWQPTSMVRYYARGPSFVRQSRGRVAISSYGLKRFANLVAELRDAGFSVDFN